MKADIPQRCKGKLFSMYQVLSMNILMLLAAKLSNESAPNPQPNDLRNDSDLFLAMIKTSANTDQKMPFIYIQSREPNGTVWCRWLRSRFFVALRAVSAIDRVSMSPQDRM